MGSRTRPDHEPRSKRDTWLPGTYHGPRSRKRSKVMNYVERRTVEVVVDELLHCAARLRRDSDDLLRQVLEGAADKLSKLAESSAERGTR